MERWEIVAGELRHLVTIQAKSVAALPDSRGHPVRTWADAVTGVWAKIETPSGRKLELARQLVPTATHVVTMRYRTLDEENNRVAFFSGNTTLNGSINASVTSITVASAIAIPVNSVILIGTEQMLVTAPAMPNGNILTVTRGYNGTSAATHASGLPVLRRRLFNIGNLEDVEERQNKLILTCTEVKGSTAG